MTTCPRCAYAIPQQESVCPRCGSVCGEHFRLLQASEQTDTCCEHELRFMDGLCIQCWKQRAEKAEAACAEMRKVIEYLGACEMFDDHGTCYKPITTGLVTHALSTDCGKGWGHRETIMREAEEIVKKQCARFLEELPKQGWLPPEKARTLRSVCCVDQPWPVWEVLDRLGGAAEHLCNFHDCDHTGHEEFARAVKTGFEMARKLQQCFASEEEV